MEISPVEQALLFLYSLPMGAFLGLMWDGMRLFRMALGVPYCFRGKPVKPHTLPLVGTVRENPPTKGKKRWINGVLFCTDILYFLLAFLPVRLFYFRFADGVFRFYSGVGILLGFLLYYRTLGKLFIRFSSFVLLVFRVLFLYLLYPLRQLFALFRLGCKTVYFRAYARHRKQQIYREAEKGFFP